VQFMLDGLSTYIALALQENLALLSREPQSASYVQPKIAMLQNPTLHNDIVDERRWFSWSGLSSSGRPLQIACLFPAEAMRADAIAAVRTLESVLPRLEQFFDRPFPVPIVRVWYGFVTGTLSEAAQIYTEDRGTYESRTPATRVPYDAMLGHELAHSYVNNESLAQFVEMYVYNVLKTGDLDPSRWTFTRGWVPGLASNQDSAAVMDIYQLVGDAVMKQSYRAVRPLFPLRGQPLSDAVVQAFMAQVPESLRDQVSAKLARITF